MKWNDIKREIIVFILFNGGMFLLGMTAFAFGDKQAATTFARINIVGFVITLSLVIFAVKKARTRQLKTAI